MAEISPELRAALDAAKERIKVEPYFIYGMNKGMKGNGQSYWAGMGLGGLAGIVGGGIIGLTALAANILLPMGLPLLMLGTMALGSVAGATMAGRVGTAAGAASGVVGEFERRMKADKLEQEVLNSPEKQREIVEAYRRDPVVEKDNTVGEALKTTRDGKGWRKVIDFKTMALTITLGALFGMAVFAGGAALGGGALLAGLGIKTGAMIGTFTMANILPATAIGAAVGATIGGMFGITMPMVFSGFTKFSSDMLSQKLVRGQSSFAPVKTVAQMQQEAEQVRGTFRPYIPEPATDRPSTRVQQAADIAPLQEAQQQVTLH